MGGLAGGAGGAGKVQEQAVGAHRCCDQVFSRVAASSVVFLLRRWPTASALSPTAPRAKDATRRPSGTTAIGMFVRFSCSQLCLCLSLLTHNHMYPSMNSQMNIRCLDRLRRHCRGCDQVYSRVAACLTGFDFRRLAALLPIRDQVALVVSARLA